MYNAHPPQPQAASPLPLNPLPRLRALSGSPKPLPLRWGAALASDRGPVLADFTDPIHRNAIGTHGGPYSVYRGLAVATGQLHPNHRPDLRNTSPSVAIGPFPSWFDPSKIVALDPWGAQVTTVFAESLAKGYDIRPTIAVTQAHLDMPELREAVAAGRLRVDGEVLRSASDLPVTKVAIDPVWYLPGLAERLGVPEMDLRQALHLQTGGMFPELIHRLDLPVYLPPIGGTTVYIIGDPQAVRDPSRPVSLRVHDECNGSDVFGSDICTCRPYLIQGIEDAIQTAQRGGVGFVVYCRKEGRALGEVTKFLVYNARKRQEGGDRASTYFERTECVAGVQDMRFQALMPDVLHWLGITRIDRLVSMSHMKYDAIVGAGIAVGDRIALPADSIPPDAQVEMQAKRASGYYSPEAVPDRQTLERTQGRQL